MRRNSLALTGIIIVFLIVGFFYVRSTPHYSLYQLKRAVENHDPDEALKYINIDSIVDNLSKEFFGKGEWGNSQEGGKGLSLKKMVADALPEIKDSARSSFRASIASRNDGQHNDGKQREKAAVQPHKNPAPPIGGIEIGDLDLRKIKKSSLWDLVVEKDGKTAMVHIKNTPGIKARMVKTEAGHWQVVEILFSK